ncbi:MAG TPA: hypothetical protein DCZ92_08750 [Elusimicrobia bacterium]|nr:MAG: hypothetical protein A2016_01770 [Elusimicrobia bacterium GWF2_62_30]HBA60894.1 hypothetical protein [Elusimicrobiota bacterium]
MNKKWTNVVALAAFLVLACGGFYYLRAQMGGGQGGGQRAGGSRPPMGMMGGMMGGGAAMISHKEFIFVFTGGTLYKIEPGAMKIEKELALKPKMPAGAAQNRPAPGDLDEE